MAREVIKKIEEKQKYNLVYSDFDKGDSKQKELNDRFTRLKNRKTNISKDEESDNVSDFDEDEESDNVSNFDEDDSKQK